MPPRLPPLPKLRLPSSSSLRSSSPSQYLAPFLYPFLYHPRPRASAPRSGAPNLHGAYGQRNASVLGSLRDNAGSIRHKRRVGRGASSSKGKTSGRGHKGQKQKGSGKLPRRFEGGQTPQHIVNPVGGFKNNLKLELKPLNLSTILSWISQRRLDPTRPITVRELKQSAAISNVKDGVKLLGNGANDVKVPLHIVVSRASRSAIEAVERVGGQVHTRYYTRFAIRQIVAGKMDPVNSLESRFGEEIARAGGSEIMTTSSSLSSSSTPSSEGQEEASEGAANMGDVQVIAGGAAEKAEVQVKRKQYLYRLPDPIKRKDLEYYRDPAHRGYLAHTVPEGQSPSLFWKVPKVVEKGRKGMVKKKAKLAENRIF